MLTIKQSKKAFWVVTGVIFLVIVTLTIGVVSTTKNKQDERRQFISKIPYAQEEFGFSYSKNKDQIYVNIFKEPYDENRQLAEKWIKDNGQNPENLKLFYTPANKFKSLNK